MAEGTGNSLNKTFLLTFMLGLSLGVLFATIYTELYGMNFILSCGEKSSSFHGDGSKRKGSVAKDFLFKFDDADDEHHKGGDAVAKSLAKRIRVLCWVFTSQDRLHRFGKAVKETWGKRCSVLVFMSNQDDKEFGAINLEAHDAVMSNKWSKTRAAWKYIHKNHLHDADWFLKADDDTYVIMENLRLLLTSYSPTDPAYLGRWFKTSGEYNTESTGYVFSKETLRTFARALNNPMKCKKDSDLDDSNVGKCLAAFGIHPSDTRDADGKEKFHPFAPEYHIIPDAIKSNHWLHGTNKHPVFSGLKCCSENSISFHGIESNTLYILEYLVYHLKPYGFEQLPKHLTSSKQ